MDRPDIETLMGRVERVVAERRAQGAYDDPAVARAERSRLSAEVGQPDQIGGLIALLHSLCAVDYRGPGGGRPRGAAGRAALLLKRGVWRLLDFYHQRLFGQQNAVNHLIATGIGGYHRWFEERAQQHDARIEAAARARAPARKEQPPQ